jgi:hypothetical protein
MWPASKCCTNMAMTTPSPQIYLKRVMSSASLQSTIFSCLSHSEMNYAAVLDIIVLDCTLVIKLFPGPYKALVFCSISVLRLKFEFYHPNGILSCYFKLESFPNFPNEVINKDVK